MLNHTHRDRRELFDLVARRLAHRAALLRGEHMPAAAARRPVLDYLVDCPRWQQRPAVPLVAILGALLAATGILTPRRGAGQVRTRRARGVARALPQLSLELLHPRLQLLDTPVHPQQNLDNSLTPSVIDRLRLSALHNPRFDTPGLCPPNPLNGYEKAEICRYFLPDVDTAGVVE
jgi:hypothetical protein